MLKKLFSDKKKILIILVIILGGIIVGRTLYLRSRPSQYLTAEVERSDLKEVLDASGKIKAEEAVDLHFQAAGKLAWIGVREGDKVNKWQAVASLDKRTLEKQLRQDLNDFEKEMRDYGQAIDDNPQVNQRFQRILEQAHYDLTSAVIDVEIRNLAIELATLISPIEGVVTEVDIPVAGVNVTATDTISIVNPQSLYFEVEVDEADIGRVKVGQKAAVILDAFSDEEIDSEVTSIAFKASTSDGGGTVFRVKLSLPLDETGEKYRLGMSGESTIVTAERQDILTVPVEAVKTVNEAQVVEVLVNGKPEPKPVTTGLEGETSVEVISGLSQGETVITGIKEKE